MKTSLHKKRVLMIAAGVFVLIAVIALLWLLLRGGARHWPASPSATPTATVSPMPSVKPAEEPSTTPEPMITPPAAEPGNAASGSDIQVSIQLPATDSDLG